MPQKKFQKNMLTPVASALRVRAMLLHGISFGPVGLPSHNISWVRRGPTRGLRAYRDTSSACSPAVVSESACAGLCGFVYCCHAKGNDNCLPQGVRIRARGRTPAGRSAQDWRNRFRVSAASGAGTVSAGPGGTGSSVSSSPWGETLRQAIGRVGAVVRCFFCVCAGLPWAGCGSSPHHVMRGYCPDGMSRCGGVGSSARPPYFLSKTGPVSHRRPGSPLSNREFVPHGLLRGRS